MLRRSETREVAAFLYEILVAQAPSKDYAKKVAERMDLPYASLARYWQGRAVFPAGLVRPLFEATSHDARVAEFFLLKGTGFRLERGEPPRARQEDVARAVMLLDTLEGEISRLYLTATHEGSEAGRQISFAEARSLEAALRTLCRAAEDLRALINEEYLDR